MKAILLVLLILSLPLQFGRHFWLKESFIFGLKIDYLSPTLYLQDILVIFLIVLERRQILNFVKSHWKLVIGYWLLVIANIIFALTPLLSFFAWVRVTELIVLGMVIVPNKKRALSLLGQILPVVIISEFILGFWQVLKQASIGGVFRLLGERTFNIVTPGIARADWLGKVILRPYGTFSHPNSLSGFILVSLLLLISKSVFSLWDKLALACGLVLLILGFSRVVWLCLVILGLTYLVFRLWQGWFRRNVKLSFVYLTVLFFLPVIFFLFSRTEIETQSFLRRQELATFSLKIIKEYPLLGVGLNNFIITLSQKGAWQWFYWLQPVHNIFLLVASETGLVGLGIFVIFLVLTIKRLLYCYIAILLRKLNSLKKQDNKITRYQLSLVATSQLSLVTALFAIIFTGMFDHYWLTLIQNQLLLTLVLSLSWGMEDGKIV